MRRSVLNIINTNIVLEESPPSRRNHSQNRNILSSRDTDRHNKAALRAAVRAGTLRLDDYLQKYKGLRAEHLSWVRSCFLAAIVA